MRKYVVLCRKITQGNREGAKIRNRALFSFALQIEKAPKGASADFPITKQERK